MPRRREAAPRLFEPEEIRLRPAGAGARLRALASTPQRPPTPTEARRDEDRRTMRELRDRADILCQRFGLRYKAIEKERDGVNEHYGICYEDGLIRIRLRHARTGRLLKESSLVDTLCHELAHLKHLDHSIRFRRLYGKILDVARELGYYRPGPVGPERDLPRQLSLFGEGCGTTGKRS